MHHLAPRSPAAAQPGAGTDFLPDDDALRSALREVSNRGWNSPAGHRITAALPAVRRPAVWNRARKAQRFAHPNDLADICGHAWEVMQCNLPRLLRARRPWNWVRVATERQVVLADMELERDCPTWLVRAKQGEAPRAKIPVGVTAADFAGYEPLMRLPSQELGRDSGLYDPDDFGPGLRLLLELLVAAGANLNRAEQVLLRGTQVAASRGRTQRHRAASRDSALASLGLSSRGATALMTLLCGPAPRGAGEPPATSVLGVLAGLDTPGAQLSATQNRLIARVAAEIAGPGDQINQISQSLGSSGGPPPGGRSPGEPAGS